MRHVRRTVYQETPGSLTLSTPTRAWFVPFMIVHAVSSDVRVILTVVSSEYRRVLVDDEERQPAYWQ